MIRDTSSYIPLQTAARSARPSLRALARIVLGLDIQTGEHSSIEDARVTMEIFKAYQSQWEASLAPPTQQGSRATSAFAHTAPPSSPGAVRYHQSPALSGNALPFSINVNLPNRSASSPVARMQSPPGLLPSPYTTHNMQPPPRQASASPAPFYPSVSANAFMDPRYSAALAVLPSSQGSPQRAQTASPAPRSQGALRYSVSTQQPPVTPRSYANATTTPVQAMQEQQAKAYKPSPPYRNDSTSPISIMSTERTPSPFSSPSGGDDSGSSEESQSAKPVIRRTVSSSSIPPWSAPQKLSRKKRGARAYKKKEEAVFEYLAVEKAAEAS